MDGSQTIRQSVAVSVILMAALFLGPLAVIRPLPAVQETPPAAVQPQREPEVLPPETGGETDGQVFLTVLMEGEMVKMDLGTYLTGVLRAEMPALFHPEALKAQAAAARTYTLYKMLSGGHGDGADVCTDFTCCQAYLSEEAGRMKWGEQAAELEDKVRSAVRATDGQAVLYGGIPILAVFHASSAGMTRNAGAVWQNDLPYLQAVPSPENAAMTPDYYSRVEFTQKELREKLQALCPEAVLKGPAETWLTDAVRDGAGSVETVKVGGVTVKGSAVRAALGLRSACFEWETENGTPVFYVTGHGHGVGLSQYGANRMAQEGADWQEILTHYYTGVTVGSFSR